MEVLSRLLRRLPTYPGFSFHPKCVKINLTHLIFADDLLVFTRGDLPSIQAVDVCLDMFASFSGLRVNPLKSNLYFGGVSPQIKSLILAATGYVEGAFPVRYLGIPLFSARLTQQMFVPLLEKIRSKINHWANHLLSYAGKCALVNSVIFGLQNFWGASVLLPKGVVKKINKLCKDFLWGIGDGQRKMVFKSWRSLCCPLVEGGINIKEVLSWNKCLMLDWIRKIELNSPTIWVRWINAYVLKGVSVWDFQITPAFSWSWHSIIHCRDSLLQLVGSSAGAKLFLLLSDFKSHAYDLFREHGDCFPLARTLGDSMNFPKHVVISLLALQNKLSTVDNICARGLYLVNRCALCECNAECRSHLFFTCPFSSEIWLFISQWLHIGAPNVLSRIARWFQRCNRGKSLLKRQRRCAFLCSLYLIWQERNKRVFEGKSSSPFTLIRKIVYLVLIRSC
ncbi:uncharacterized protein LOC141590068 [Silene latifolia]|uniref:uncharacterized protein LOC141590068 n=1 Tax=Silene latifolia TaxID=37657 RepID=UPI003D771A65